MNSLEKILGPHLMADRLATGMYRYDSDGELEKRCSRCRDYWPADTEFFHASRGLPDMLHSQCRACTQERRTNKTSSTKKGTENMSNPTRNDILTLLRQRPGLNAVQISDLLDIDVPVVEGQLKLAEQEKQVAANLTLGANGQMVTVYRIETSFLDWKVAAKPDSASVQPDTVETGEDKQDKETSSATTSANFVPSEGYSKELHNQHKGTARQSLVDKAIAYLEKSGPTSAAVLKDALGISYQVSTLLRVALSAGTVKKAGGFYCLADREDELEKSNQIALAASQHSDTNNAQGGLIELLRERLSPDEFRGFLKGSVIFHTLGGHDAQNTHAFHVAGEFAKHLAATTND
ncbi:hypothetical protein [Pseudoduganella sp. RAF53_2]|uniref:hypothetical protein n=1 Tax=unclassified Pseudoduganella TaxID=2637179 RepID=UPI003F969D77